MNSDNSPNLSQEEILNRITPEELEKPKTNLIKYLQYLSILFSILFSIAGIYYFLLSPHENVIVQQSIKVLTWSSESAYSWWIRMGDYIWSNEIGHKLSYKEANDFCYNLTPRGIWKIPDSDQVADTHYNNDTQEQIPNRILTGNVWYYENILDGVSNTAWCYNPEINTLTNCNPLVNTVNNVEQSVRCITDISKIDSSIISNQFPWCNDTNIILNNGQIWSACDIWATERWDKFSTLEQCRDTNTDCNDKEAWHWKYFQFWTNNASFVSKMEHLQQYGEHWFFDPTLEWYDWGSKYEKTDTSRKWACPTWWHIPTITEWKSAYLVSGNNMSDLQSALYLPETGFRDGLTGTYTWFNEIYYWSSSSSDTGVILPNFGAKDRDATLSISMLPKDWNAYAIRCIKNQ